jgi:hypothetical protein
MLLLGRYRDGYDLLLVIVDIESNQGFKSEIFLSDIELFANMIFDLLPMTVSELIVSEGDDDRHCFLESLNPRLQLLLDQVRVKVLLEFHGCLEIFVCFELDVLSLNRLERSLIPNAFLLGPGMKRAPHLAPERHFLSTLVQVLEHVLLRLERLLPLVVLGGSFLMIIESLLYFVQFNEHLLDLLNVVTIKEFWIL